MFSLEIVWSFVFLLLFDVLWLLQVVAGCKGYDDFFLNCSKKLLLIKLSVFIYLFFFFFTFNMRSTDIN